MSEANLGAGFRYSKLVAWAPAVVLAFAAVLFVMGQVLMALALTAFSLLAYLLLRRRRRKAEETVATPSQGMATPAGPAGTPEA